MAKYLIIVATLALAGCATKQDLNQEIKFPYRTFITPEAAIEAAQEDIRYALKDPESAKFRGAYYKLLAPNQYAVCVQVNAKNAFGGYVGYAWARDIPSLQNQVLIAPNKFANDYVTRICN